MDADLWVTTYYFATTPDADSATICILAGLWQVPTILQIRSGSNLFVHFNNVIFMCYPLLAESLWFPYRTSRAVPLQENK